MAGALISAKLWLLGLDPQGRPLWRHDATIRVDDGMVAQIGAWPAASYGVDLPHYGDATGFALPLFAPPSGLAARFGGAGGRLTPGSAAHVAVFTGRPPRRAALREAVSGRAEGVRILLDGRPDAPAATSAAWRRALEQPETPEEAALWEAALAAQI